MKPRFATASVGRRLRLLVCTMAWAAAAVVWPATGVDAAQPAAVARQPRASAPSRTMVDHAVVPASGCRGCGQPHCKGCRLGGHHHAGCRDGKCHPYCPVRPQEFGFYGTQWRRWPGQGVVPVSNEEAAMPAKPPKSEVPQADEESRKQPAGELPEPDAAAAEPAPESPPAPTNEPEPMPEPQRTAPEPEPDVPAAKPAPVPEPEVPAAKPAPAPEPEVPAEPKPAAKPVPEERKPVIESPKPNKPAPQPAAPPPPAAKPAAEDENLFDESAAGPVRRRFAASRGIPATELRPARNESVRTTGLAAPIPAAAPSLRPANLKPVPRVPFDPAAEAARRRGGQIRR